jgi:hypothetical protein
VVLWAELLVPTCCDPKLRLGGVNVTAGAGEDPVPLSPRLCGVSAALSAIDTPAEREPEAPGENVTEIVHVAFTPSVAGLSGHVFVCAKSPAFAPATAIPVIANGAVPEFVSVAVFAALVVPTVWLAKVRLVGVSVTAGAVPLPVSGTVCGLPPALSVTERLAVRLPVVVGVNVTEMAQLAPAASVAGLTGHVFV